MLRDLGLSLTVKREEVDKEVEKEES